MVCFQGERPKDNQHKDCWDSETFRNTDGVQRCVNQNKACGCIRMNAR